MVWYESLSSIKSIAISMMCCACFFVTKHHHTHKYQYIMHIDENCGTVSVFESKNVENAFWNPASSLIYDINCILDDSIAKDLEYEDKINKHGKFNEILISINVVQMVIQYLNMLT